MSISVRVNTKNHLLWIQRGVLLGRSSACTNDHHHHLRWLRACAVTGPEGRSSVTQCIFLTQDHPPDTRSGPVPIHTAQPRGTTGGSKDTSVQKSHESDPATGQYWCHYPRPIPKGSRCSTSRAGQRKSPRGQAPGMLRRCVMVRTPLAAAKLRGDIQLGHVRRAEQVVKVTGSLGGDQKVRGT